VSDPGPVVLVEDLPAEQLQVLREALAGYDVSSATADPSALERAAYVIVRDGKLDGSALAVAPGLQLVVRIDVGEGIVDEEACAARGIPVVVIPSTSLGSVAEHTVMLILMLFKRFQEASERLHAGVVVGGVEPAVTTQESYAYNWVGLDKFQALLRKRVGLVGLGRIGMETARLLRCFGVDVVYTKRNRLSDGEEAEAGVSYVIFDELLATSDCVSLHARFYPETDRMMGRREFELMKPGSLFVNTARGRLVDEAALVAALKSGHLAGAALDVFWYEPLPKESPLLRTENLLLTPHTAGIPMTESLVIELLEAARAIKDKTDG